MYIDRRRNGPVGRTAKRIGARSLQGPVERALEPHEQALRYGWGSVRSREQRMEFGVGDRGERYLDSAMVGPHFANAGVNTRTARTLCGGRQVSVKFPQIQIRA